MSSLSAKNSTSEDYKTRYLEYFEPYKAHFSVYRNNVSTQAFSYMNGLLRSEKGQGNPERFSEDINNLPYHQYHHFLTNSPWSYKGVLKQVSQDADTLMRKEKLKHNNPTGLIGDESSHLKKGNKSVRVSRQYAGVIGKVDNCQVGVYMSLCNGKRSTLIDERLFLPKQWANDENRCLKADIPKECINYKTKPTLFLEMVDRALSNEIDFDWVGGDGLYGNNYDLCSALDKRTILFVLDIHKDQHVYLSEPALFLPNKKSGRGRTPSRYQTNLSTEQVQRYAKRLTANDWKKVKIHRTTKGWLIAKMHCITVWTWDKIESKARKRTLIIRKTLDKTGRVADTKYSLSNGGLENYTIKQFAYFQAQRYWVVPIAIGSNFDDGKNELSLSDDQVRKWKAWHHHHTIVILAMLFLLQEQIDKEDKYPLMSLADARKIVITLIAQSIIQPETPLEKEIRNMKKRHSQRKKATQWHFNQQST